MKHFFTIIFAVAVLGTAQAQDNRPNYPDIEQQEVKIHPRVYDGMVIVYPGEDPEFEYDSLTTLKIPHLILNKRFQRLQFIMVEKAWAYMRKTGNWGDVLIFQDGDLFKATLGRVTGHTENHILITKED